MKKMLVMVVVLMMMSVVVRADQWKDDLAELEALLSPPTSGLYAGAYGLSTVWGNINKPSLGGGVVIGSHLSDFVSAEINLTQSSDKNREIPVMGYLDEGEIPNPKVDMNMWSFGATMLLTPPADLFCGIKPYCGLGLRLSFVGMESVSAFDLLGSNPEMQNFFHSGGKVSGSMDFETDPIPGLDTVLGFSRKFGDWMWFAEYRYTMSDATIKVKNHMTSTAGNGEVVYEQNGHIKMALPMNVGMAIVGVKIDI